MGSGLRNGGLTIPEKALVVERAVLILRSDQGRVLSHGNWN
jgi:hypothetical protein